MNAAHHYVEDDALQRVVARALDEAKHRRLNNQMRSALVRERVDAYLARCPMVPDLVGVSGVAEMLGIAKPRVQRYRDSGRLPEPVKELPSGPIWIRDEVKPLADELAAARRARRAAAEEVA